MIELIDYQESISKKFCSKCKKEKPNNEDFFYLDKAKVKRGHTVVLSAACKECQRKQKRKQQAKAREKIKEEFGSVYRYRLMKEPDFKEKIRKSNLKYKDKIYERNKRYRKEKRSFILKSDLERSVKNKKETEEMSDYYLARLICKNDKSLKIKEILEEKEFINLYRENLKLKRLCHQLKTSMN